MREEEVLSVACINYMFEGAIRKSPSRMSRDDHR
jgi:hypothetical protein